MQNAVFHATDANADLPPTPEWRYVTPEAAENMLGRNERNRNMRNSQVRRFVQELRDGTFKLTHQGIMFGKNNILLDGQHRL